MLSWCAYHNVWIIHSLHRQVNFAGGIFAELFVSVQSLDASFNSSLCYNRANSDQELLHVEFTFDPVVDVDHAGDLASGL